MLIRKTKLIEDRTEIETDKMGTPCAPLTRVMALAVLRNAVAGIAGRSVRWKDLFSGAFAGSRGGENVMRAGSEELSSLPNSDL